MKDNAARISKIQKLLQAAFKPTKLEIIDDSHKHIGHAGAASGAGHFTVIISSKDFDGKNPIESHRMIYQVLDEMIGPEIHALSIKVV